MAIPRLMCTQHPDSAVRIPVSEEVREAILGYRMYGCDEVMVDFEGKLTPYSQPRDIVLKALEEGIPVGKEFFVTVRVPNPKLEGVDRLLLALESAVLANYYSVERAGVEAVRWVVVPMVDSSDVLSVACRALREKARLVRELTGVDAEPPEVVPLLEGVSEHLNAESILSSYLEFLERKGIDPKPLRVFVGKSDAALRSGHLASLLSTLHALSSVHDFARHSGVDVSVILGMGSPPFRGGLNNPSLAEVEARLYRGFDTATLQSAVRYDVPREVAQYVSKVLRDNAGKPAPRFQASHELLEALSQAYRSRVTRLLPAINDIVDKVPQTRERLDRRLYGRFIAEDAPGPAPRAIAFTAACYSVGFPPILLDAHSIVEKLEELSSPLLEHIKAELELDYQFFVPEVAGRFLGHSPVREALDLKEKIGVEAVPRKDYLIAINAGDFDVVRLARIRGFLG